MVPRFLSALIVILAAQAQAQSQSPRSPQPKPGAAKPRSAAAQAEEATPTGRDQTPPPAADAPKSPAAAEDPATAAPELPAPPGFGSEPQAPEDKGDEISLEDWSRDDWVLVQPKTALLELDGYMRLRGDLLRRLDFGNGAATERTVVDRQVDPRGTAAPRYFATQGGKADFTGANMRLRVEPEINVTEDIHIVTTVDILDNIVLGSTPLVLAHGGDTPLNVLGDGQSPPVRGETALTDSIVVKRVYARVTALNEQLELRFGRMPSEWGLGVLSNAGDCLDCDFGDIVDRISLAFKIADLLVVPMYDWVSSGPVLNAFGRSGGQPLDGVPWDDAEQYSLRIMRVDAPEQTRARVVAGESVFNYGIWGIWRRQKRDLEGSFYTPDPDDPNAPPPHTLDPNAAPSREARDANLITGDGYFKLHVGGLELGAEAAAIFGSVNYTATSGAREVDLLQFGGALELAWRLKGDYEGTVLALKAGGASGDSAAGFGALDQAATQFGFDQVGRDFDSGFKNFQFSPDYHVDLLLFRRVIGTVTDAWYVSPEVSYTFGNNIGGRFAAVYSQAFEKESTPGRALPLGLEFDAEFAYGLIANPEGGSFKASLAGGALIPFAGFKNLDLPASDRKGSFAWTIQTRLYITF